VKTASQTIVSRRISRNIQCTLILHEIFFLIQQIIFCSFKQIKASIKDDESILLGKKPAKAIDVSRAIYDLVQNGIKGIIKRDVLLSTLADLTVRMNFNA
jgi:hypothetical protein